MAIAAIKLIGSTIFALIGIGLFVRRELAIRRARTERAGTVE